MSIKQALLIEIERETANTRKMIERIEDKHLSWQPHQKSMTLGALASHIVELHNWVGSALVKNTFDFHIDYIPFQVTSQKELLEALDNNYVKNIDFIKNMNDQQWFENWELKAGEHTIVSLPKIGAVRFIIQNHLIHHRGQLSVYLRMLDIPVPGIYGPSADEK